MESGAYQPLLRLLSFSYQISYRVLPPSRRCARHEGLRYQPTSHDITQLLEQYHSTPETQDAASYSHPEDIEHFSHHETIELKEAELEAVYQGISVEEALAQHAEPPPSEQHPAEETGQEAPKKFERQIPAEQQDPAVRFREAKAESEAHGEWGSGDGGYKSPNSPSERMRKNLPYKVMLFVRVTLLEVDIGAYAVQVPPELGRFLTFTLRIPGYFVTIFIRSFYGLSEQSLVGII